MSHEGTFQRFGREFILRQFAWIVGIAVFGVCVSLGSTPLGMFVNFILYIAGLIFVSKITREKRLSPPVHCVFLSIFCVPHMLGSLVLTLIVSLSPLNQAGMNLNSWKLVIQIVLIVVSGVLTQYIVRTFLNKGWDTPLRHLLD